MTAHQPPCVPRLSSSAPQQSTRVPLLLSSALQKRRALPLLLITLILLPACAQKRRHITRDPRECLQLAVSDADPDARRIAITRVAESRVGDEPWAVAGYKAIALLERDPQTRSVAIRALGSTDDLGVVTTMLKILNPAQAAPGEVTPPDALSRWDAVLVLVGRLEEGGVTDAELPLVRDALARLLRDDPSDHVRTAAADGLGCFAGDRAAVATLIDGLKDDNFATVQACESSLVRLTGVTHRYDHDAWNAWYAANRDDLFADAGQTPPDWGSPYRSRTHQRWVDTKRFFRGQ